MPKSSKYPIACPELILEGQAFKLLSEWWSIRSPISVTVNGCHCELTISIKPLGIPIVGTIGDSDVPMTECERDIIDVLKSHDDPLTRPEIMETLEAENKIHGESTVRNALARLARLGQINSPGAGKRTGYSVNPS